MKKTVGVLLACLTLTVLAFMYMEYVLLKFKTRDLFPPLMEDPIPPELPVVVTAFSSNHFAEGMFMLKHLKEVAGAKYKNLRVIMYDLGLTETQYRYVEDSCSCEMRTFLFDSFPKHFLNLKNFAWKPIIIQSVAKEYPLVFWMDASVRFKTGNLDRLITAVKANGLMIDYGSPSVNEITSIAARTHKATFDFLHEDPCLYAHERERHGGLILLFANKLITRYILLPWVSCALSFGCMEPVEDSIRLLSCERKNKGQTYHICHRFDQSVIGILLVRLFRGDRAKHAIDRKYHMFCRSPEISAA